MENETAQYKADLQNYEKRLREWNLSQLRRILVNQVGGFSHEELSELETQTDNPVFEDKFQSLRNVHPVGKLYLAYLVLPVDGERARNDFAQMKNNQTPIEVLFDDHPQNITVGEAAADLLQNLPIGFHPSLGKPLSPEEKNQRDAEYQARLARRSSVEKAFDSILRKLGL